MSFDRVLANIWNSLFRAERRPGLKLGFALRDGEISRYQIAIPDWRRSEHIAIVGKTGTGKSSLLKFFMSQDIRNDRGFVCIDLHGDLIPFILSRIAEQESRTERALSKRLLIIDPADPKYAVGLNLIECTNSASRPVQISEMVTLLRQRWSLDHFGARTEELLRNALWVLSQNALTLLEMTPLLTDSNYRELLLRRCTNEEVRRYFAERYNRSSQAMQAVIREAVLNKVTAFTVDSGIRHIVGQQHSSFSLRSGIDQGSWILLDLRKGRLGDNALTFAGLFLSKLRTAIFGRSKRNLFTVYADELPNLVSAGDGFETLLSESRKFAVSIVSANQFLNQFSPAMKSALFSVGTILSFQLSSEDAPFVAKAFDGERSLIRRLITLPHRRLIGKFGERTQEVSVPNVQSDPVPTAGLLERSLTLYAKTREQVESEINARRPTRTDRIALEDWD